MTRLPVQKTLKLYVGGKFIRSESGRTQGTTGQNGAQYNVCLGSRKDLRASVVAAHGAQSKWAAKTAYNRGQILYRLGELLEHRSTSSVASKEEVFASADRAVHHAGWADKIGALLSSLNPVSQSYVNYSTIKPIGVVVAVPNPDDGLLGLVEALCVCTVMSNSVIILAPPHNGEVMTELAEVLATCDMPSGVVNLITGNIEELVSHGNKHDDIHGFYVGADALSPEDLTALQHGAARVMRRILLVKDANIAATPIQMNQMADIQTVWMSNQAIFGSSSSY